MRRTLTVLAMVVALALSTTAGALAYGHGDLDTVETVTEDDLGPSDRPDGFDEDPDYEAPEEDWFTPTHGNDPLNTEDAHYGFVAAPGDAGTYGNGSFLFDVPAGERSWILTDQYGTGEWHGEADTKDGVALDELDTLAYSTFISDEFPTGSEQAADLVPSLQIMAFDGSGDFVGLVFDPPSEEAETGQWQRWDALDDSHAGWRLSWEQGPEAYRTWSEVVENYPDAVIGWQIGVAAGTWPAKDFHGYTDLLTVGVDGETTTHDFEPSPATKDDCKDGGWEDDGFKNQGQCIRYVNTGKDSR